MSRSLDLTGSDWGWRKKDTKTYRKAWDWVGLAFQMRAAGDSLYLQVHLFIYTASVGKRGGVQVAFSWVQSSRRQEQHSCGMLLFTADYHDYINMLCFPCKAALLNLVSP
jgi:hypothetical protein